MKTLEDQLNEKADAELKGQIEKALGGLYDFPLAIGGNDPPKQFSDTVPLKNTEGGKQPSISEYIVALRNHLFHGYKEAYREKFRKEFVDRSFIAPPPINSWTLRGLYLSLGNLRGHRAARKLFDDFRDTASAKHIDLMTEKERCDLFVKLAEAVQKDAEVPPGLGENVETGE